VEGDEPLVKIKIDNPVTIATNEIAEDMVGFTRKELSEDDKDDSEQMLTETDEENQTPEE